MARAAAGTSRRTDLRGCRPFADAIESVRLTRLGVSESPTAE